MGTVALQLFVPKRSSAEHSWAIEYISVCMSVLSSNPKCMTSRLLLKQHCCNMQTPIYLVVETSGSNAEHDYAKLEKFLEEAYEEEIIVDGTIAQDSGQQASIWALRENISEGLRHAGT